MALNLMETKFDWKCLKAAKTNIVTSSEQGVYVTEVTVEKYHHLVADIALDLVEVNPEVDHAVADVEVIVVAVTVVVVVAMIVDVLIMTSLHTRSMERRRKRNGVSRSIISLLGAVGRISKTSCERPAKSVMVQLMEM